MSTVSRISLGKIGEDAACAYLERQGYKILKRNFRYSHYGEIDIIAEKSQAISFIEVKARKGYFFGRPEEAVTLAKQRKIHRCAEYFLQTENLLDCVPLVSFDVVSIILEGTAVKHLVHFPHCF